MPSLRTLSKALDSYFTVRDQDEPLPQNVLETAVEYAETFAYSEPVESQRLHEELVSVQQQVASPKTQVAFLEIFTHLLPCLTTLEQHKYWFGQYINPALDSAGQLTVLVTASRNMLLKVMIHDYDVNDEKMNQIYDEISKAYSLWILDIYLDNSTWFPEPLKDIKDEERARFRRMNAKDLLVQFGNSRGKQFMTTLNERMILKQHRVSTLVLMSVYACRQPRQLFEIQHTPLLESLFSCLQYDLSATALSICANVLAMTLPHICNTIVSKLPRILSLYGRLACWRLITQEEYDLEHGVRDSRDPKLEGEPQGREPEENDQGWETLGHHFNIQDERKPSITPLFTFLYGLFPSNLLSFLRKPTKYLEKRDYKRQFSDFWDEYEILAISKPIFELHVLHPALVSNTAEEELRDERRFEQIGSPQDIASYCLQLYNQTSMQNTGPPYPNFEMPFEDAPTLFDGEVPVYSHLYSKDDGSLVDEGSAAGEHRDNESENDHGHNGQQVKNEKDDSSRSTVSTSLHKDRAVMPMNMTMESLLDQHARLYTKPDNSSSNTSNSNHEKELTGSDSSPSVSEESPAIQPYTAEDVAAAPPKVVRNRSSGSISSPGFFNHKSPSMTPISTPQVSSPKVEQKNALGHVSNDDDTISSNGDEKIAALNQKISEQHEQILFLNRELMIQKNELDFVSFIEQHSQYKYKQMRKDLFKKVMGDDVVRQAMQTRMELRKEVKDLRHELDTTQKNTKTYKRERQQYEQNIMEKSKEFRQLASEATAQNERLKSEIEELRKERDALNETMIAQEVKISKFELRLAEAVEKSRYVDSYKQSIRDMEDQLNRIDAHNILEAGQERVSFAKSHELQSEIDSLKIERDALQEEMKQQEVIMNKQLDEARAKIVHLESAAQQLQAPGSEANKLIEDVRSRHVSQFAELRKAYDELVVRNNDLENKVKELRLLIEEHDIINSHAALMQSRNQAIRSLAPQPPKKSLLGYDVVEEPYGEGSSIRSGFSGGVDDATTTPPFAPIAAATATQHQPQRPPGEIRIRGRGGVQNLGASTSSVNSSSASNTPSRKSSKNSAFRGLRM